MQLLHGLLLSSTLLSSCASPGGPTLMGTLIGAMAGTGMGFVADAGPQGKGRSQNVFAGATIGALIGVGVGFGIEQVLKKPAPELAKDKLQAPSSMAPRSTEAGLPTLIPPRVEGQFVDDQVRGNTFVPGHFEYQIKEPAKWGR